MAARPFESRTLCPPTVSGSFAAALGHTQWACFDQGAEAAQETAKGRGRFVVWLLSSLFVLVGAAKRENRNRNFILRLAAEHWSDGRPYGSVL